MPLPHLQPDLQSPLGLRLMTLSPCNTVMLPTTARDVSRHPEKAN
jgi:hypothetical protein